MVNIKHGDAFPITFTVNHNLTGAETRLIVRHLDRKGALELLPHEVTNPTAGSVEYALDGTWGIGRHFIELEITQAGEVRTAPTDGTFIVRIVEDLDEH